MERDTRERVEVLFKTGSEADAPNLLACTPTLEMGIDVGDLSSTMLCSVPPTPTNYLQRIGRAGRATGNALILALANVKPHDLYFFDDPFEMIAGTVNTPGCFLDAPEMLKRQYLAFCLDTWASEGTNTGNMPPKVMMLLAGNKRGEFPANFLKWYGSNKERLIERFLGLFEGVLSDDNVGRMKQYALSDDVPNGVNACLERTEAQIEEYRRLLRLVRERRKRIEEAPEKTDNAADVLDDLRQEAGMLRRLITQIQEKYPLNLFTDEGLLPNYAFPETGVKLKSIIYGIIAEEGEDKGQKVSQAQEYIRGASTAIRELAPFNTFYAEARKVEIDQVETGGRSNSQVEEWRFCDVCSHMERETEAQNKVTCPNCGSPGWADVGQKRSLLKLLQVSARSDHLRSQTSDDSDERERRTYLLKDFIDIRPENWGGGQADVEGSFGFEYLKQVTLREINFGPRDSAGRKFTAAGEEIPEDGFTVCGDCGVVRPPQPTAPCSAPILVLLQPAGPAGGLEAAVPVPPGGVRGDPFAPAGVHLPGRNQAGHVQGVPGTGPAQEVQGQPRPSHHSGAARPRHGRRLGAPPFPGPVRYGARRDGLPEGVCPETRGDAGGAGRGLPNAQELPLPAGGRSRWLLPLRLRLPAAERTRTGVERTGHRDAGRDSGPVGQASAGPVPFTGAGAGPLDRKRTGGPIPDDPGGPPEKARPTLDASSSVRASGASIFRPKAASPGCSNPRWNSRRQKA